jgi:hypothetical protein
MQLSAGLCCAAVLALTLAACGGSEPAESAAERRDTAPRRETVFDPLTSTIDRAEGVQQTVDQQAAEQRRRIEEAER